MSLSVEQIKKMKPEEIAAYLAAVEAAKNKLSFKVSEKGAVSIIGLQRFPVTLYIQQWERVYDPENVTAFRAFVAANSDKLSRK